MENPLIINDMPFILPKNGRILLSITDGEVSSAEILRDDMHIVTLAALLEIAERAGYKIIAPEID
ncbi:hypothetical protein GW590_08350 [Rahnella sp. SAP-1]|uniref:Uncharacterized protein n=1 Tax=Rouxiella aceris TaxID=2703884 RepID=A0A848MI74_9GAMM|nr:hypothetical protein [Rouxiella aceris]NMP26873.1 hypothetical protein [Rouxiella aceris]